MDSQTSFSKALDAAMWKGSARAGEFPHRCPLNPNGVDRKQCVELSGSTYERNRSACCGAERSGIEFPPCNSSARRCIKCLEQGRRGEKAGAVTDEVHGLCDEHQGKTNPAPDPPKRALAAPLPRPKPVEMSKPATPPSVPIEQTNTAEHKNLTEKSSDEIVLKRTNGNARETAAHAGELPSNNKDARRQPLTHREPNENLEVDSARVTWAVQNSKKLTQRELEVLLCLEKVQTDEQIAAEVGLTVSSLAPRFAGISSKLGIADIKRGLKRRTLVAVAKELAKAKSTRAVLDVAANGDEHNVSRGVDEEASARMRPPAISEAAIELGARRVELLPQDVKDIVELAAEDLDNVAISERLNVPYGNVTTAMSFAYRLFELNKIADFEDKREAMALIVRRSRTLQTEVPAIASLHRQASADRQQFEDLELLVNQLLDIGESILKLIHGRRHSDL